MLCCAVLRSLVLRPPSVTTCISPAPCPLAPGPLAPSLLQDHVFVPYQDILSYEDFSIRLSNDDLPHVRLHACLRSAYPSVWAAGWMSAGAAAALPTRHALRRAFEARCPRRRSCPPVPQIREILKGVSEEQYRQLLDVSRDHTARCFHTAVQRRCAPYAPGGGLSRQAGGLAGRDAAHRVACCQGGLLRADGLGCPAPMTGPPCVSLPFPACRTCSRLPRPSAGTRKGAGARSTSPSRRCEGST